MSQEAKNIAHAAPESFATQRSLNPRTVGSFAALAATLMISGAGTGEAQQKTTEKGITPASFVPDRIRPSPEIKAEPVGIDARLTSTPEGTSVELVFSPADMGPKLATIRIVSAEFTTPDGKKIAMDLAPKDGKKLNGELGISGSVQLPSLPAGVEKGKLKIDVEYHHVAVRPFDVGTPTKDATIRTPLGQFHHGAIQDKGEGYTGAFYGATEVKGDERRDAYLGLMQESAKVLNGQDKSMSAGGFYKVGDHTRLATFRMPIDTVRRVQYQVPGQAVTTRETRLIDAKNQEE